MITQSDSFTAATPTAPAIRTVVAQQSGTGSGTQTQVYENGLLKSETLPGASEPVGYTYTGFGELETVVHPLNGTTTRTYYPLTGQLHTLVQTGVGLTGTSEEYDYVDSGNGFGQVGTVMHKDNSTAPATTTTTTYTYDEQSHIETQSGTAGYPLRYEYDGMGRLWKLHTYRDGILGGLNSGDVTTWNYDTASGVLSSKTDAASRSVSYTYDVAGRVHVRTWARGATTTYGYDGAGRRTSIVYSGTSTPNVSMTYDRLGRRLTTTDAAGNHVFTYDAASGGQTDTWTVSGSGAWSGLSMDYDYTSGRRSSRSTSFGGNPLPAVGYTWNAASGTLNTVTASGFAVTYGYSGSTGWNSGVAYTGGPVSTRTPDALGRLDSIVWNTGATTLSGHDYTLNGMNRRTAALRQNGTAWNYGYNTRGEVTSAAMKDATSAFEPGKKFAFEYDGIGNRTSSKVSSIASSSTLYATGYTPNSLNQYGTITHPQPGHLVLRGSLETGNTVKINGEDISKTPESLWFYEKSVDNAGGPLRYTVEVAASRSDGGRNGGPVTTKQKGALFIPPPSEVPTYDDDGNLTSDARWNYTWDGENRLIVVQEKTGITALPTGAEVIRKRLEFSYDAHGRRISKRSYSAKDTTAGLGSFVLQQSLVCLYDGWNMTAEIDSSSATLLRSYEWGTDISGTMDGAGGVGGLLVMRSHTGLSSGAYAPLYDGNGNVTELVNLTSGSISARYEYGAFGETISVDGGAVVQANPFRFSTKYVDAETELYYYGYRYYNTVKGRWLSVDPIGIRGGGNINGMCGNDVVNSCDYLGLAALSGGEKISISTSYASPVNTPVFIKMRGADDGQSGTEFRDKTVTCWCGDEKSVKSKRDNSIPRKRCHMSCRVEFTAFIKLSPIQARERLPNMSLIAALRGILGHEQRHLQDRINLVNNNVTMPLMNLAGDYAGKDACEAAAEELGKHWTAVLKGFFPMNHSMERHDSDPNTLQPEGGVPYDPLPGTWPHMLQGL